MPSHVAAFFYLALTYRFRTEGDPAWFRQFYLSQYQRLLLDQYGTSPVPSHSVAYLIVLPRAMVEHSSQYSPVDAVDDEELFGAEPPSRPKSRILRLGLWLSHGMLMCTSMLFFTLWMSTPSTHLSEDIAVYCKRT